MKAQFFIISTVIMIYVIVMTTQNLYSFSDIKITKAEEILELNYVPFIKNSLIQTLKASFYSSELVCDKTNSDLNFTEKFLKEKMNTKGIKADFFHNTITCPITYFNYTLKTKELFTRTEFVCPKTLGGAGGPFFIYNFSGITLPSLTHKADNGTADLPSSPDFAGSEAVTAGYTNLSSSDNNRWQIYQWGGVKIWQKYRFKINEEPSSISNLTVLWEGYGEYGWWNGATCFVTLGANEGNLEIWNFSSNSWSNLTTFQYNGANFDYTKIFTFTKNINFYLNQSGYIFLGTSTWLPSPQCQAGIFTDFVKLEINSSQGQTTYSWDC